MNEENDDNKNEKGASEQIQKVLFDARKIFITGEINKDVARDTCARLLAMAHVSDDPITVIVSSPGGHVESGDMIHDMIKFVSPKVRVLGTGWVASAGALIYVAADKEDRYALPNTRFLLHQPSGGVRGDATNIDIAAQEIVKMRTRLNKIFAEATGNSLKKIEADVDRDFWLECEDAKKYGIVGKIIQSESELG
ncbi:MAG: ATP-dependent Clp protease proteolytic subunit [Kordiimonadaceae bacterium]|nr:ATP-dependent Clp protease proteolytic subunit [Kordiimonadaceae bacterium]MBO6570142.1 ATP-dependent Clp protease proteolytic subunit [Kordiimonadaceae bacterium]MBO6965760.1 ATP-dependent Clp protease proteolytic subunit [Kordiimonadaceae bacterium]